VHRPPMKSATAESLENTGIDRVMLQDVEVVLFGVN
jgi:hypothetical protein